MKIFRSLWISVALLVLWLLLSWFLGSWIGLHAPAIYYLRGGLSILGIIGFIGYLLLRPKSDGSGQRGGVASGEMDDNFNEAAKRLQAAGVRQLASMPAVFFLGDTDTAKTTVIVKSDIAQLLSGQAQQDVSIVPTRAVNFWLAKSNVFVDPAGALLDDPASRGHLFKKFSAVALRSVMGSGRMPARSVVLTVSCEMLLQKGGAEAMAAKARQLQTILSELAQEIGSRFPVYVLFTKADKLSYFRDFVENLSEHEAAEVFGVTLPLETHQGVFAQQQTSRLNEAFQQLYYWLADRRPVYLVREHKPIALPNIYEFPREFNKLRPLLTSFLVDLSRPSQLGISPFLRGFYFTGIRAVTVNDVAPAALQVPSEESAIDTGATRMFTLPPRGRAPLSAEVRDSGARRIPQWVYLSQFLPGVILADSPAVSVGGSNVKLNVARRFVLGAATAAALLMGIWWTISYSNNRTLIHGALDAAHGAPSVPSLDALQRLTNVKDTLETLNYFEEHGRPLSYGGFLYSGDDVRESVRKTYYGLFRRLLLAPTQQRLVQVCTQPSNAQPQVYFYDALKSYLITTEFHAKSVPEFLTPVLLRHWKGDRVVGDPEERLAQLNFDFYSRELLKHNEYWPQTTADAAAVGNCRDYLNHLGQTDPIYRAVLADAGAHGKPIIFNEDYPGTEATVVNRYPVQAAFTKTGFDHFQLLLKDIKKYSDGEPWVLGPQSAAILDQPRLLVELQRLYKDDFVKKWQAYLQATSVRKPTDVEDAVAKLDQLTGARSALLQALCVASENTSVANKDISDVFQPVHSITPAGCSQALVGPGAAPYMNKLVGLQEALKTLDAAKLETYDAAAHAAVDTETTVKQISLTFSGPTDEIVAKLLKEPIYEVADPNTIGANNAAAGTCQAIQQTLNKYPFNPASRQDASMAEVDAFLKNPDGELWKLVNNKAVASQIVQSGDTFTAKASGKNQVKDSFIRFLTRSANLSHVLYGQNGQTAGFKFTMTPVPSPDVVEHITLNINSFIQSTDAHGTPTKDFEWPGNGSGVDLQVRFAGGSDFNFPKHPGIWGAWHFMDSGTEIKPNEFEWKLRSGTDDLKTPHGDTVAVRFNIDPSKASVLRPRYFSVACAPKVN